MSRKKRKNHQGCICWCCARVLANERFGGRGHRDHLCRECARLPAEERAFRQAVRNIDRPCTREGLVPRRRAAQLAVFLASDDARVRAYAQEVAAGSECARGFERGDSEGRTWAEERLQLRSDLEEAVRARDAALADGDRRSADIEADRVAQLEALLRALTQGWEGGEGALRRSRAVLAGTEVAR